MYHLLDLPDDVLGLVVERACDGLAPADRLPLLAVCRRLRRVAGPAAHGAVRVQYGEDGDRRDGGEGEAVRVRTNAGLVAAAGRVRAVARVEVVVYHARDPLPGLWRAAEALRAAAAAAGGAWPGVRALDIATHSGFHWAGSSSSSGVCEAGVRRVSEALAAAMPGVRRLAFGGVARSPAPRAVYGAVAGLYARQLRALRSSQPIAAVHGVEFARLARVCIDYDGGRYGCRLPRISPAALAELRLPGWPPNHSWAAFGSGGGARDIRFPALATLDALYCGAYAEDGVEVRHRDGRAWRLHFPALRRLRVRCARAICPLLEYAVLPARIDDVCIEAPPPVLEAVARMALPPARRLALGVCAGPGDGRAALAAAVRILAAARGLAHAELAVYDDAVPVLPEALACTQLTRLRLAAETRVGAMLALIRRLPRLAALDLWRLALDDDDARADLSVPAPGAGPVAEPLHAAITSLTIGLHRSERRPERIVPVARCLLLRIPTLTRFATHHAPPAPIAELVDAYSAEYPHLANVRLDLLYA